MKKGVKIFLIVFAVIGVLAIVLIGILAATLIPQLNSAQARARDTGRMSSIRLISTVLETYYSDFEKYPDTLQDPKVLELFSK